MSSRLSVCNADVAENSREPARDGTAERAGWARRKVLSDREHDLVDSAADSLRERERANKDVANMTREGSYLACVLLACVTLQVNICKKCYVDVVLCSLGCTFCCG